jgi:hypothetical protein
MVAMPRNAEEAAAMREMFAEAELERAVVNGVGVLVIVVATVCLILAVRALPSRARNRSWQWGCLASALFLLGLLLASYSGVVF